jgi:hypothetical protein
MSGPNVAPVVASAAKPSSYPRDSPSTRWQEARGQSGELAAAEPWIASLRSQ